MSGPTVKTEDLKIKKIDLKKPYIEANGKKYTISKSLSVERWRHFEDLQALVGFGRSHDEIFKMVKKAYEALQHPKVADASVILHNILTGMKDKLDQRHHPAMLICALFINAEGENEKIYDEKVMNSKIEDWQKEGYDANDFFQLAWNWVPNFIENYKDVLQNISSPTKEKKSTGLKSKK